MEALIKQTISYLSIPVINLGFVLVTISGAYFASGLTWALFSPLQEINVDPIVISSNSASTSTINSTLTKESLLLFGQVVAKDSIETNQEVLDVPVTNLKLTLQGVFASEDPNEGSAIIGNKSGASNFVSVGNDIFDQAVLAKVFQDRVILDRNGILETLFFELTDNSSEAATPGSTQPPSVPSIRTGPGNVASTATSAAEVISELREMAYTDPQALIDRMGLQAGADGYQVTRRARQLLFLGLRPGDRIVSVNDNSVGNVNQDVALLDQILSGGEIKIEIQRGNRRFSIYQAIPQ